MTTSTQPKEDPTAASRRGLPSASPSVRCLAALKRLSGVDRAIGYAVMAKILQILGSTGTVLLIVRFLSSTEQGYYYTLLSLVALQAIFELGFSYVILHVAAYEAVHLVFHPEGRIEGDPRAHARLSSLLQKTVRWYIVAGISMLASLLPAGRFFFARHAVPGVTVAWQGPWIVGVVATVLLFLLNPALSFLDGCGQVRQVAAMRLVQGVVAVVVPWCMLAAHRGLYAPGALNAGYALVALVFLFSRRHMLWGLLCHAGVASAIQWKTEVWPFQWRLGISFLCSWFTIQVFTPILFASRGAVEAGQIGMSMSIAGYLWGIILPWMSTKSTPYGQLIAQRDFETLDRLFFRTLRQSLGMLTVLIVVCMAGICWLQSISPYLAARMLPPRLFVLLLLSAVSTFIVQCLAVYLRAHKREPFLWQSLVVAALTLAGAFLFAPRWGLTGVALTYFFSTGVIGLLVAVVIFLRNKDAWAVAELQADPQ